MAEAQAQMQVVVPANATPGTTLQVTAPNGLTLQVQVPAGAAPGSHFTVAYPAAAQPARAPAAASSAAAPLTAPGACQQAPVAGAQGAAIPQDDFDMKYTPFPDKRYDVTDYIESIATLICMPCFGWTRRTLILGDQEVYLKSKNLLLSTTQRRPYAQLGGVEKRTQCFCCYDFTSDLTPDIDDHGRQAGLKVGFGCDGGIIDQIIQDMQSRKAARGNVAQIRKLDYLLRKLDSMYQTAVPMLMKLVNLDFKGGIPPYEPPPPFQNKTYDVTNWCEFICGLCTTRTIELGPEEVRLTRQGLVHKHVQVREYAQLGSVHRRKECLCCHALQTDFGKLEPGLGCSGSLVAELVQELRTRMEARGEIGQIRKTEAIAKQLVEIKQQLPMAAENMGAAKASPQACLAGPLDSVLQKEAFPTTEYDVTNCCESFSLCCNTCGIAGWQKQKITLEAEQFVMSYKNNLDDFKEHMPYGQLDSVDAGTCCCCCVSVNGMSPGFGCDKALVDTIAEDLQKRKVQRGDIAQLRLLQSLQAAAVEVGSQMDLMTQKKGVTYPPSQEVMARVWGPVRPKALEASPEPPHLEPDKRFETKSRDVTDYWESCSICISTCGLAGPCTKTTMELGDEEVTWTKKNFCCQWTSRMPYAQLGSVEEEIFCFCCYELPEVARPGCGCSQALVQELASDLQERKVRRGNIAQIKMKENVVNETLKASAKLDLLLDALGTKAPPVQEKMSPTTIVAPTQIGKSA